MYPNRVYEQWHAKQAAKRKIFWLPRFVNSPGSLHDKCFRPCGCLSGRHQEAGVVPHPVKVQARAGIAQKCQSPPHITSPSLSPSLSLGMAVSPLFPHHHSSDVSSLGGSSTPTSTPLPFCHLRGWVCVGGHTVSDCRAVAIAVGGDRHCGRDTSRSLRVGGQELVGYG
jgi:hypothetical protein